MQIVIVDEATQESIKTLLSAYLSISEMLLIFLTKYFYQGDVFKK